MTENKNDYASKILGSYTDPIPSELINAFKKGRCVLLAGSGVSQRCLALNRQPLPSWQVLLNLLLTTADTKGLLLPDTFRDLNILLTNKEYLMVAQELLEILGEDGVQKLIKEILDPDGIVPSHLHELIAITPFRFCITTNYDNLLERAFVAIWKRHIDRVCLDDLHKYHSLLKQDSNFILKLHGDIDKPETIILGQKQYQYLLQFDEYSKVLEEVFSKNSVLILGYGLQDIDIQITLDRLASSHAFQFPHFLLCAKNSKTMIERKRLASDRNIHIIEYVNYFGFHNHIDTFLEGLNIALGNIKEIKRIRLPLRARISIHYPNNLKQDGLFVWNFLFREGAIMLSEYTQFDQQNYLVNKLSENLGVIDYLIFVVDNKGLAENGKFLPILEHAFNLAKSRGILTVYLIIGAKKRPAFLKKIQSPTFYLKKGFSEKDLIMLRSYLAQDIQMGYRQI